MKGVVDFFTSVRVAIVLLIILIIASILGTLIPQERNPQEYLVRYGQLSTLFQWLQLTRLYHSFWYIALLSLFGLNIIICTLARLFPKLRKAFHPRVEGEAKDILTLKIKEKLKLGLPLHQARAEVKKELKRYHYRIREKSEENRVHLLARKRISGWFGSDIVHLGILVILAGGILSGMAGRRENLTFSENETLPISNAGFSVRLDRFETEYYPNGSVKDWRSHLTVLEEGKPPLIKSIEVNHPLSHHGYVFYQSGYGWDWENPSLEIWIKKKNDPAFLEKLLVKVGERTVLEGESLSLVVHRFIPDFVLDEKNQPSTRSLEPNNPAVFIEGWEGEDKVFSGWVFAKFPDFSRIHSTKETDLSVELKDVKAPQYSVIQMAKDPGVPLIWLGCILGMAGFFFAFYWPARELRVVCEDHQGKTEVVAGGVAAKSREAFESEFKKITKVLRGLK